MVKVGSSKGESWRSARPVAGCCAALRARGCRRSLGPHPAIRLPVCPGRSLDAGDFVARGIAMTLSGLTRRRRERHRPVGTWPARPMTRPRPTTAAPRSAQPAEPRPRPSSSACLPPPTHLASHPPAHQNSSFKRTQLQSPLRPCIQWPLNRQSSSCLVRPFGGELGLSAAGPSRARPSSSKTPRPSSFVNDSDSQGMRLLSSSPGCKS
jgi:hypothetical protein